MCQEHCQCREKAGKSWKLLVGKTYIKQVIEKAPCDRIDNGVLGRDKWKHN